MKVYLIILLLLIVGSNLIFGQTATLEKTFELRKINGITVPYQNGIPVPSFEKQSRKIFDLGGEWKKERVTVNSNITLAKRDSLGYKNLIDESNERYLPDFVDTNWDTKLLPSVENTMYNFPKVPEFYSGGVWYRRSFNLEQTDSSKLVKLIFLAVNYVADVWINGEYVGYHEGGYTPFAFDVSSNLKYGSTNVIAVRVDVVGWGKRNDIIPNNKVDWFDYGGIIHDVYLEFSDKISIVRNDIVPTDITGNLQSTTVIWNKSKAERNLEVLINVFEALIDSNNIRSEYSHELIGQEVQFNGDHSTNITLPSDSVFVWRSSQQILNPELWAPNEPNLYIMQTKIMDGENLVDEFYTQFGIRIVSTDKNKFLINNRISFLPGIARHEDHPIYGRSLPKDVIYNDLTMIKKQNVNFLRTAHYPNHPYTYLILDRLGITSMQEVPLWQVDTDEPWFIQNNNRKIHIQMFREMVFKDYNRPSIIFWSTSNECHEETNRLIYNDMVVDDISQNYDDGRLITQSAAADNPGSSDITQAPLDVAGWTMYFGIFYDKGYTAPTFNFLNQAKLAFPEKPILDTEFGYWSSENSSTLQKQVDVFEQTFSAFKFQASLNRDGTLNPNGALMASTWWCIFDWYSSFHPLGFQSMGLFSMDRQTEKPVASNLRNTYLPYFNSKGVLTGIPENSQPNKKINNYELEQNYPNPFNPVTNISYTIPNIGTNETSFVEMNIYDILGVQVKTLINQFQKPGNYSISFDGSDLSSGVYYYQLKSGSYVKTMKMLLLK